MFERNHVTRNDAFNGTAAVQIGGTGLGVESPLLRCNRLERFAVNLLITGGGLQNQPRVQSNFIQAGEINVDLDACAPYLVSNTIAFAASGGGPAIGLRWSGAVAELGLSNNLLWNPDLNFTPTLDAVGPLGVFNNNLAQLERWAFFNEDEDDTFFNATGASPGVLSTGVLVGFTPDFVGGNFPTAGVATDLHLLDTSPLIAAGAVNDIVTDPASGVMSANIPFPAGAVDVRRDTIYDIDFEGRLQGGADTEIGADE